MDQEFDGIVKEVYQVLHRFHCMTTKLNMDGDLSNVEFFLLMGIAALLDAQVGKCAFLGDKDMVSAESASASQSDDTKESGITIGEINKIMGTSTSAVSKKVTILENKGLVTRTTSQTDRRNVYITLTDKGREICERENEKKNAYLREIIRRMGEEDMAQMLMLANRAFDIWGEIEKEEQ